MLVYLYKSQWPILLIIFINDITHVIRYSEFLLFADDLKLFKSINNLNDAHELHLDLSNFIKWCHVNLLILDIDKCFKITFHRTANPIRFDYQINNSVVAETNEVKDLGLILDSKLNFETHITNIVSKMFKFKN